MAQQVRFTTDKTVQFVENGRQSEKLDRGMVLRELSLKLTATVAVATGGTTTAADNINAGGLWAAVKNIDLKLNNNDSIRSISGEQLAMLNFMYYGAPPRQDTALIGIAADGSAVVEQTLILPFWSPRSVKPIDTALDARLLSDVSIEITWGDAADVGSGTGFEFSVNPTLTVSTLSSFGLPGPFNTVRVFSMVEQSVGINSKHRVQLPIGNMYRGFLINTKDSSNDDTTGEIGNLKLRSGGVVFVDQDADTIRNTFLQRNGIREVLNANPPTALLPYFLSDGTNLDGWTYLDLVTDGFLSEALDTVGFSSLDLELEILSAIDTLTIIPIEIIPIREKGQL